MSVENPYRHSFERAWNGLLALTSAQPIRDRVANAYRTITPLSGSNLPSESKLALDEVENYFSIDQRPQEIAELNIVSIIDHNRDRMTNAQAVRLSSLIQRFAFHIFFYRAEVAE